MKQQETSFRKQVDEAPENEMEAEISFFEFNFRKTVANMVEEYSNRLQDTRSTGNSRKQEAQPKYNVPGYSSQMRASRAWVLKLK